MKISAAFYRNTLLPSLFTAKYNGVNIKNKSALLHYYSTKADTESETFWVCCASGEDLKDTAEIVSAMFDMKHDVIAEVGVRDEISFTPITQLLKITASLKARGKNKLANKLNRILASRLEEEADDLNKILWDKMETIPKPENANDNDVKAVAKEAKFLLNKETGADELVVKEAVESFIDQNYLEDIDFKGDIKRSQVLSDLYYKNRGDDLDDLEVNSDVSEEEINLGTRQLSKFL